MTTQQKNILRIPSNLKRPVLLLNTPSNVDSSQPSLPFETLLEKDNATIFHEYIYPLYLRHPEAIRVFTFNSTFSPLKTKILRRKDPEFGFSFYGEKLIWHLNTQFYHINNKTKHPFSRKLLTPIEKKMEKALKKQQISFKPQQPVGDFVVDFLLTIEGNSIALECDGADYHEAERDRQRDQILWEQHNIPTIRFTGSEIHQDAEKCVKQLVTQAKKVKPRSVYKIPGFFDEKQKEAIQHTQGPCRVLAPAGSGKTAVLIERLARLIKEVGVRPERILAITFTKKAAEEMRQRMLDKVGPAGRRIEIRTYHSLCHRYVAGKRKALNKSFPVLEEVSRRLSQGSVNQEQIDIILKKALHFEPLNNQEKEIKDLYFEVLKRKQAFTFTGLLIEFQEKLQTDSMFRSALQHQYEFVLVDESQDNNNVQDWLTKVLGSPQDNLFWVGDDDQVIYSFTGSSVDNFLSINAHYPHLTSIFLEHNYRCHPQIVQRANNVIVSNNKRELKVIKPAPGKSLDENAVEYLSFKTRVEEAKYIANYCRKYASPDHRVAILYRNKFYPDDVIEQLKKKHLPFYIRDGIDLTKVKIVKRLHAYLACLLNLGQEDEWKIVLQDGLSYIRKKQIESILEADSLTKGIKQVIDSLPAKEQFKREKWRQFLPQWETLKKEIKNFATLQEQIQYVRTSLHMEDDSISDDESDAIAYYLSRAKDCTTFEELYNQLTVKQSEEDKENQFNILLFTIHSSKGKQFDCVFLVGVNEDILPHKKSIRSNKVEEERRVCYVGMTRAQSKLYLTTNAESGTPSRFLEESKEPKMSCETCSKSIPKIIEYTCSSCNAYTCPEHTMTCHTCGKQYCPQCTETCECKEFVCRECQTMASCCNRIICPDEKRICTECNIVLCTEHQDFCTTCSQTLCHAHTHECQDCGDTHCQKHVQTCQWCHHKACSGCYETKICPGCKLVYCKHCIKGTGMCTACTNRQTLPTAKVITTYKVPANLFGKKDMVEVGVGEQFLVYYEKKWFGLVTKPKRIVIES